MARAEGVGYGPSMTRGRGTDQGLLPTHNPPTLSPHLHATRSKLSHDPTHPPWRSFRS